MKPYWRVTWWDRNLDKEASKPCPTYEKALILQARLKDQGHSNIQIIPRGSK